MERGIIERLVQTKHADRKKFSDVVHHSTLARTQQHVVRVVWEPHDTHEDSKYELINRIFQDGI